ncbi:DNA-binding protein, KilA-N domain [Komagataeibacter phage phiKX2]|nr:DNA-binding protein, KilA-N domain [Komagataeibacter phage phiKX2]
MTTHNTSLTILSTAIRQDAEGRFCLNDCHKAAGGDAAKRPGEWMRNEQTQALIAEMTDAGISASPVFSKKGGINQGTYVAKELVYAYAMWISPAFHLQVIRAFDAMVMGKIEQPATNHLSAKEVGGIVKSVVTKMKTDLLAELEERFGGKMTPQQQAFAEKAMDDVAQKVAEKESVPAPASTSVIPADMLPRRRPNVGSCRFPVAEVARHIGVSVVQANLLMAELGLQDHTDDNNRWALTDLGSTYYGMHVTKRTILWSQRVITILRWHIEQKGAALVPFAKKQETATV